MNYEKITLKKQQLDRTRPLPSELAGNLDDWFRIEVTFTSNAIKGNSLTRQETALVVEKGLTVGGKPSSSTLKPPTTQGTGLGEGSGFEKRLNDHRPRIRCQEDHRRLKACLIRQRKIREEGSKPSACETLFQLTWGVALV